MRIHHLIDGKAVEGHDTFETVDPAPQDLSLIHIPDPTRPY